MRELLESGIDVISTVNVQHLESLNDVVEQITGVRQHETVPDSVVRGADQVELVDMTPEAIRRRMAHGNIYAADRVDAALGNYFRPGNLSALRELALLWLADKVEAGLQQYMTVHGISAPWETRERVVVALTGAPSGEHLIRRAARMARRAQGDLVGVHVSIGDGLARGGGDVLALYRRLLADLGGEYHEVVGNDVADVLVQFARTEKATQLVLGASGRSRRAELLSGSVLRRTIRSAGNIDVHVIGSRGDADDRADVSLPAVRPGSFRSRLSQRRIAAGWAPLGAGVPLLTLLLDTAGARLSVTSDLLLFLVLVTVAASIGGAWPGIVGALVASLAVNWFFVPPVHTFTIAEAENALSLVIFVGVAVMVSRLTARGLDAERATAEAEALARMAGGMAGDEPLAAIARHVRATFGLDAVRVRLRALDGSRTSIAVAGDDAGLDSAPGATSGSTGGSTGGSTASVQRVPITGDAELELVGPALTADDQRVLRAFTAQLGSALEREQLRADAAAAAIRGQADELRTAILRAVSHDLRTPLASIKASVTSLKQHDVAWTDDARSEFLDTIDEETDRLNRLVGNLLDMSRIEAGALAVHLESIDVADVIAVALAELGVLRYRVEVRLPDVLPFVVADSVLLERTLANLLGNAVRYTPVDSSVRLEAGAVGAEVHLRVVDRGPGVAPDDRARLLAPFQRTGDHNNDSGVGLGLAVARGFVDAMGARLELDDTPGGGLTAVVSVPAASSNGPEH